MAKKINQVANGDVITNTITLRSVWGKVGQTYFIQPQRGSNGRYPDCVKRVDSNGDIILTQEELAKESKGLAAYIKEDTVFKITDGKTYNLDDIYDKAEWEAIKNSELIAEDRYAKDSNGNYLIDGTTDSEKGHTRYGSAELYVDRPGLDAQRRVTRRQQIVNASNYIINDERGYEGRVSVAKVLGRNMNNMPNADVEDYLLSIAEKTPQKIIDCYTGGDMKLRIFFVDAREEKVIIKKQGLYMFGETTVLGATEEAVIEWMKDSKNAKILAMIRKETYPDMFDESETK